MASVLPVPSQPSFLRHACGEMNPADAHFCGGCGSDLTEAPTCTDCGRISNPGVRFCHGCGTRFTAGVDPGNGDRMDAFAEELASLRVEMEGLMTLKSQLDGALSRIRQRGGPGTGKGSPPPKSGAPRPEAPTTAAVAADEAGLEVGAADGLDQAESVDAAAGQVRKVAVVHVEDRPELQVAVQGAISCFSVASYHPESSLAEGVPEGRPIAVVNLLASGDPLSAAADPRLSPQDPRAFIYATDGARGFVLGMVELFPAPFDPGACARRILAMAPAAPRVLMVSEAVLGTPELRGHLVRQGCTTSIAFDERQALSLLPSVRPNLVLIDLNLPRGESLRFASRLRSDEHHRHIRIGFMWQQTLEPALLRQFVTRATLDYHFSEEDLRRGLMQEFNPGGAGYVV